MMKMRRRRWWGELWKAGWTGAEDRIPLNGGGDGQEGHEGQGKTKQLRHIYTEV